MRRRYGDVQYCRAAEIQNGKRGGLGRGALHFHVLVWVERSELFRRDFRSGDPHCPFRTMVMDRGFGHSIDVKEASLWSASYCSKYVSKAADERGSMPWLDLVTGEIMVGQGRYRPWSASRRWGATMKEVKAEQAAWAASQAKELVPGERPQADPGATAAEGGPLD